MRAPTLRSAVPILTALLLAAPGCSGDDDGTTPGSDAGSRDSGGSADTGTPSDSGGDEDAAPPSDAAPTADAPSLDGGPDAAPPSDSGPPSDAGPLSACDDVTDDTLRSLIYGGAPRVPAGYYAEPDEPMAYPVWQTPCSPDPDTTRTRATTLYGAAALTGAERTTEQFYEVDAVSGGFTVHYRNTRCDFFDGLTLGGAPHDSPDRVPLLAGYTWWVELYNLSGSAIAAGIARPGGPPHILDLCHVQTVYGDFGLCDEITLYERTFTVARDGATTIDGDRMIRTVRGMCH